MASRITKVGHLNCGDPLADPALGEAIGPKDHHSEGVFFLAWIELHQSVVTHRKTLAFADALDIEPVYALGHLVSVWLWALDNAPDGTLESVSDKVLARAAQWTGDPSALRPALVTAKYLDENGALHDWDDYAGKLLDQRRANAQRQRAFRGRVRGASDLELWDRDGGKCRYCAVKVALDKMTADHVIPLSQGGLGGLENLVTACGPCNQRKNNRTPEQARMPLLPIVSNATVTRTSRTYNAATVQNSTVPNRTEPKEGIPEPLLKAQDVLVPFVTRGFIPDRDNLLKVGTSYPNLDLDLEFRKLADWLRDPKNRKEQCSWRRIFNWLKRAEEYRQSHAHKNGTVEYPPPPVTEPLNGSDLSQVFANARRTLALGPTA